MSHVICRTNDCCMPNLWSQGKDSDESKQRRTNGDECVRGVNKSIGMSNESCIRNIQGNQAIGQGL